MMQQMIRGMLARRRHRSRLQVLQEYPILLANHDRLALAQFVSSYAHYIVTGDNNNSDDDNVDTKKNSTLSSSSFKEIIRSAQRLHDHLLRVEHGASVVRTLLTRMQDPSERVKPIMLETALNTIDDSREQHHSSTKDKVITKKTEQNENIDLWLTKNDRETIRIGMHYILRVQTLRSLRKGLRSALRNGDTMEAGTIVLMMIMVHSFTGGSFC